MSFLKIPVRKFICVGFYLTFFSSLRKDKIPGSYCQLIQTEAPFDMNRLKSCSRFTRYFLHSSKCFFWSGVGC